MVETPQWYVGLPDGDHPVAQALGRYFAESATIEFCTVICFAAALGHGQNRDVASAILGQLLSVSAKIDMLEAAAKLVKMDEGHREMMLSTVEQLRQSNARRNQYAHGLFEHTNAGDVRLRTYPLDAKRKKIDPQRIIASEIDGDRFLIHVCFQMSLFLSGQIDMAQLQPWLEKLNSALARSHPSE
jgi:hypothetical protein